MAGKVLGLSFKKYFDLGIVMPASFPKLGPGSGPMLETLDYALQMNLFRVVEISCRDADQESIDLRQYLG